MSTRAHTGVPRPLQRCSSCWIAALPVASQRNLLQRPRVGPTGQAELVASQRSLQQCTARCIAPPAVATQRHPLQRSVCAAQRSVCFGTAHPHKPASAFWDCAHRSPPDWAHTRPHLHRDQVHPRPTSATGLSRSLVHLCALRKNPSPAHICPAKESIPSPHLHRNRVHAQAHICVTTAALRDICLCATHV